MGLLKLAIQGAGTADTETSGDAAYPSSDLVNNGGARMIPAKTTSKGSSWILDPDQGAFNGTVEVPRPSGGPRVMENGSRGYHTYDFEHVIEGAERLTPEELSWILRTNAAPNDDLKVATPKGSNNDAAYPAPFNQVKSYDRVSSDGQHWVVNVTRSAGDGLHILSDGWVASTFVRRPDGKIVLRTYGEGNSFLQDPNNPIGATAGKAMNEYVWRKRADHVQRDVMHALQYQKIKRILGKGGI